MEYLHFDWRKDRNTDSSCDDGTQRLPVSMPGDECRRNNYFECCYAYSEEHDAETCYYDTADK